MNAIAVLHADLRTSPLGGRSRLADLLKGVPTLRRTVDRLSRAKRLAGVHVVVSREDVEPAKSILGGTTATLHADDWPDPPYLQLTQASRIWAPDSWRGGIGGLCWWDEETDVAATAEVARRAAAHVVVVVPAAAVLIDPGLVDDTIAHYEANADVIRLAFAHAPPGLGVVLMARTLLDDMAATGQPAGATLTYRPDQPQADLTGRTTCYRPAAAVLEARGRVSADTRRSFERVEALLRAGADGWSIERIGEWLHESETAAPLAPPEEIELELTTEDSLAGRTLLRPRGPAVPPRGPMSLDVVRDVCAWIDGYDDVRIVLGGFGEPALHSHIAEATAMLRAAGAAAIALRTSGLVGGSALDEWMFGVPIDAVIVALDAARPETYFRVHGVDGFAAVRQRIEGWALRRAALRQVRPMIVPEFIKSVETFDDLEQFYDEWMRYLGTPVIAGPSTFAGQVPDRRVTRVTPPRRKACRQLFRRALVLADGTLATCDQDFAARQSIRPANGMSLAEQWRAGKVRALREAHRAVVGAAPDAVASILSQWPLCSKCEEWHRP